ncbi:9547_t:CDS:1, partial [Racocetra persica]
ELVNTPPTMVKNPIIYKPRGRPTGAKNKNKTSVRRDLSASKLAKKQSRQYGKCHQTGHNFRIYPNV